MRAAEHASATVSTSGALIMFFLPSCVPANRGEHLLISVSRRKIRSLLAFSPLFTGPDLESKVLYIKSQAN